MGAIDWSQAGVAPAMPAQKKGAIDWDQVGTTSAAVPVRAASTSPAPPAVGGSSDFWDAAKHHLANLPYGGGQLLAHGVAALAHKVDPGSDADTRSAALAARADADMANREKQYQARVPNSAGAYAGATAGELAPFLLGGPMRAVDAIGDGAAALARALTGGSKVAANVMRGGAQGAAIGAVSPATQNGEYAAEKVSQVRHGATVGAVIPPALATAGALGRQLKSAVAPFVNPDSVVAPVLEKMAPGVDRDALIQQLRNPEIHVPGSTPTTAQILQTPQAVMVEKTAANTAQGKVAMTERQLANNSARLDHIKQFAGTDDDLAKALALRKQNAQPTTDAINQGAPIDAAPIVRHLDSISSSGLGTDPVIRSAIADARKIIMDQGSAGENGGVFVKPDILDGIRQNVRGFLTKNASNGAVSSRQEAALEPLKNTIVDTIDRGVPGYRDYLAAYRSDSVPVNTMERLQNLGSQIDTRAFDASGNSAFTLTHAQKAVRDLDRGQYPIAPEASAAVDNTLTDLQRESVSNSIRSPGSDTSLNLQAPSWLARQMYGDDFGGKAGLAAKGIGGGIGGGLGYLAGSVFGPVAAGSAMGSGSTLGALLAGKVADAGSTRVNDALVRALMNPDVAASVLEKQVAPVSRNQALANFLRQAPLIGPYVDQPSN